MIRHYGLGLNRFATEFRVKHSALILLIVLSVGFFISQPLGRAQTFTILYQFKSGPNGIAPAAGVSLDTKRIALYGTTQFDGQFASGTAYKLTQKGETVLHSFSNNHVDGAYPHGNARLLLDPVGNLYGATASGGLYTAGTCAEFNGCGVVFRVDQAGKETILHQFTGEDDGWLPRGPLVADAVGNLYGMAANGGAFDNGLVYKIDHAGNFTVLHAFNHNGIPSDAELPDGGLVRDQAGNLYGTALGLGRGSIFKIDPAGNESLLYIFGSNSPDGFVPVNELTIDAQGNLYGMTEGSDNGNGAVFKITPTGEETLLHNFGPLPDAESPSFNGVVLDPSGTLYGITTLGGTSNLGAIFKIDTAGNESVIHSFSGPDGKYPYGALTRDPQGNLYGTTSQGGAFGGGVIFRIKP